MTCCSASGCSCSISAGRVGVSAACRTFGVHRSTYYAWKRQVDRHGLEMLRPRERRRPRMPNQLSAVVEERIVAFALAHPGLGPRRIASELARPRWGGIIVSGNGVWRCLRRQGLNTRSKRLSLVAGYRAPYEPPRDPAPEPHIEVERPSELVGIDCFYVGRLRGTAGAIWQLTAIDCYSSYAWAELVICKQGNPTAAQTSKLARRLAAELKQAGWRLERVLCDNGNEYRGERFHQTIERLGARITHIHAGRPQTNGHVEALHKTILDECWRPAFARHLYPRYSALSRELDRYLAYYNLDRVHHGRLTNGRIPADIIYRARKMEARSAEPVGTSRRLSSLGGARTRTSSSLLCMYLARGSATRCSRDGFRFGRSRRFSVIDVDSRVTRCLRMEQQAKGRMMARARRVPTSDGSTETFTCPECGKTFSRAASLGAHRQRVHGVAGASKARSKSKRGSRRASASRRQTNAALARPSSNSVNRDALLQMLFPNGVPAREDTIRRVTAWLDEAEELAAVE